MMPIVVVDQPLASTRSADKFTYFVLMHVGYAVCPVWSVMF